MNWYYTDRNKQRVGPVPESVLLEKIRTGDVTKQSYVWNGKTVTDWVHANEVEELKAYLDAPKNKAQNSNNKQFSDPFADLVEAKEEAEFDDDFGSFEIEGENPKAFSPSEPPENIISLGDGEKLIETVNRLRDLGAHTDIDLPVICLCGQQSCGKSSVSEAISGVPLPRASGTCTRCPTEVRLITASSGWSASVGVRMEFDDIRKRPLKRVQEKHIGNTTNVREVEHLVRRAQSTILQQGKLKFSRNIVVVTIRGAGCPNLTLIDLPGLIFATEKEEDHRYIRLVQQLVEEQIKKPNTLIAACVSAKDDMENQIINTLIRKYDPDGTRTIGVITKVDTIEDGLEDSWVEIVENQRYPLKLGYALVKNPSQLELNKNLSRDEYRQMESDFFKTHKIWGNLGYEIQERMGSENLIKLMSDVLGDIIKIQLPKIKQKLTDRSSNIREQLMTLPPKPILKGTPKDTIMFHVLEFVDDVKECVRSTGGEFWVENMKVFSNFFAQLEECKPRFHTMEGGSKVKANKLGVPSFNIPEVMKISQAEASRALHFSASPRARKRFIQISMKPWAGLTTMTISNNVGVLNKQVNQLMKQYFGQYPKLMLSVKKHVDRLILEKSQQVQLECAKFEHRETLEFTLSKANLRNTYQQAFRQLNQLFENEINKLRDTLAATGETYLVEEAIMVMAESLSYYDLSYRRYADVVTMAIEHSLFRQFVDSIHNHLFANLKILNNEDESYFANLLQIQESPLVQKRIEYEETLERLDRIMDELQQIPVNLDYSMPSTSQNFEYLFKESTEEDNESQTKSQTSEIFQDPSDIDIPPTPKSAPEAKPKKKKKGWF